MTCLLNEIENNLNDLYEHVLKEKSENIKDTYNRILISQDDLDKYINFCKTHIHLNFEEANKLIIRYHNDIKEHTSKLYDLIRNLNDTSLGETDAILNKLSGYLDEIDKELNNWQQKSQETY